MAKASGGAGKPAGKPVGKNSFPIRLKNKGRNPHFGKKIDYSSKGVKTDYFSSNGWQVKTSNVSEVMANSEASANRAHDSHMAYDARHTYERQKDAERRADLDKAALEKGYIREENDFGGGPSLTTYRPLPGLFEDRAAARHHEIKKIKAKGDQQARLSSISAKSAARTQRSNTFRLFLSNIFESRQDRKRVKAHKRSIKQSAKEQRRTIAMQRGYW